MKGNPTALLPLFAPPEHVLTTTPLGDELRGLATSFLSRAAARRFLGFMQGQRDRLVTGKDTPNRPELVAKYGYDVKYASHALRLAYQGLEITRDRRLTLPMPEVERTRVLQVKSGGVPDLSAVLAEIDAVAGEVERRLAEGDTPLPEQADEQSISTWSSNAHRRHWGWA